MIGGSVTVRVPGRSETRVIRLVSLSDETWAALAPLIPPLPPRRPHVGGRRPLGDRQVLAGVLTILANGIGVEALPGQLGYGSGMTCWRRLRYWQQAGAWPAIAQRLREVMPPGAGIDLARVDGLFAACGRPRARRTPGAAA